MGWSTLYPSQIDALNNLHNGCVLCSKVGSGKSITALAWYYINNGGDIESEDYVRMKNPKDLYIITTARKRDTREWEQDMIQFLFSANETKLYSSKVVVDSWNNIKKYSDVSDAYFIFDEQRVIGKGEWVKAFYKITKKNKWILLSATPGDTWIDYIPLFVANGFYKNRTEFIQAHVTYKPFTKFLQVDENKYRNTGKLIRLRNSILVDMDCKKHTIQHHTDIICNYDFKEYKRIMRDRCDPDGKPYISASEVCYALRRCVNSNEDRINKLEEILNDHKTAIIFYNYDYELSILRTFCGERGICYSEWNGHKHQTIPESSRWVYLVQYTAGAEGWNCTSTDTTIFYSQTYSYKQLSQSCGRIDRLNTPFTDLYYFHLLSRAPIDLSIFKALSNKKNFNEGKFINS
jgi:hypothetical protein